MLASHDTSWKSPKQIPNTDNDTGFNRLSHFITCFYAGPLTIQITSNLPSLAIFVLRPLTNKIMSHFSNLMSKFWLQFSCQPQILATRLELGMRHSSNGCPARPMTNSSYHYCWNCLFMHVLRSRSVARIICINVVIMSRCLHKWACPLSEPPELIGLRGKWFVGNFDYRFSSSFLIWLFIEIDCQSGNKFWLRHVVFSWLERNCAFVRFPLISRWIQTGFINSITIG